MPSAHVSKKPRDQYKAAPPEQLVLDAENVAAALHVHVETAYRILRVIGVRIGRRLVVSRRKLEEWVETGGALPRRPRRPA